MVETAQAAAPERAAEAAGTVVLAAGLWMPQWVMRPLSRRLRAAGFATATFAYPSVTGGLDENAARLAAFAAALPAERLHFVGHSLGGVVAVRMLGRGGEPAARAGRLVCLGSPLVACRGGAWLLARPWGRPLVGRGIAELVAAGGLGRWEGACELGILAGDFSLGFGRLLGGLPVPNDGTVAVEETRLPGAAAHRVLHVTHTSLLWSAEVAAETVRFLRTGRFSQPRASAASS